MKAVKGTEVEAIAMAIAKNGYPVVWGKVEGVWHPVIDCMRKRMRDMYMEHAEWRVGIPALEEGWEFHFIRFVDASLEACEAKENFQLTPPEGALTFTSREEVESWLLSHGFKKNWVSEDHSPTRDEARLAQKILDVFGSDSQKTWVEWGDNNSQNKTHHLHHIGNAFIHRVS